MLAQQVSEELREYLEPVQLGVGTKCGCEAVVHVVRQWLHRNRGATNKVLVTLDLQNAFNSIDRSVFLQEVRRVLPGLAPWVDYCYRGPSKLVLGPELLESSRGIQQGDPLGPALFAIAIQEAIVEAQRQSEAEFPGGLDFTAFFLDDGTVAGDANAVAKFAKVFQEQMAERGLTLAPSKCEVVPPAEAQNTVDRSVFHGWKWIENGNFKLLGAPLGKADFCESLAAERVAKAEKLLSTIREYGDTQGGLLILRHCGSWCKLMYCARTVPPALHKVACASFSNRLRHTLEAIVGDTVPDRSWDLAQMAVVNGGIGLRDPVKHAGAAYLGSLAQTQRLCTAIDKEFDVTDATGGLHMADTLEEVKAGTLDGSPLRTGVGTQHLSQKAVSKMMDAATKEKLSNDNTQDPTFVAHLCLNSIPGAGVWLTAPPVPDGRSIDPPLFQAALQRRLRLEVFNGCGSCPCCGEMMDRWGDHSLVCSCNGDRTIRHNAVRDVVFQAALEAGVRPQREKSGLLPGRPAEDGLAPSASNRRPADIWLPRSSLGGAEALDFAVTSGLRADRYRQVAVDAGVVFAEYEDSKRAYKQTDLQCQQQGLRFTPMILEAHGGGWSTTFRRTVDWIATKAAASQHEKHAAVSLRLAQRISCILQRENARAVVRRHADEADPGIISPWVDVVMA